MPRRAITFSYGCYYHIYNRGARRQSIFRCDENYRYLLRLMKKVAGEWCADHYRLLFAA